MNTLSKGMLLSLIFAVPASFAAPYDSSPTSTPSAASTPSTTGAPSAGSMQSASAQVDLNSATETQLQTLPGLSPRDAKAIVNYRSKNGSFKTIDDLKSVPGFNAKKVDAIKSQVTVSGGMSSPATPN